MCIRMSLVAQSQVSLLQWKIMCVSVKARFYLSKLAFMHGSIKAFQVKITILKGELFLYSKAKDICKIAALWQIETQILQT